jgi:hypothetical protein
MLSSLKLVVATLFCGVGLLIGATVGGCGSGSPLTQPEARDRAAGAVCDLEGRCGDIGDPPATYATRDACLTTWKGNVQSLWPPAECTKIIEAEFNTCVASIMNQTCGNGVDLLATLSKCGKASVCSTQ